MKLSITACLATVTLALSACGSDPQVDEDDVDPTYEGEGDMSSAAGAGALTEAAPEEAGADMAEIAGEDDTATMAEGE